MNDDDTIEVTVTSDNITPIMQTIFGADILVQAILGPPAPNKRTKCDYGSPYGWIEMVFKNGHRIRTWGGIMLMNEDELDAEYLH